MYDSMNGLPTPLTGNLGDLLEAGTSSERPVMTQVAHNMGNRTFLFTLPMKEFYDQSIVANERGDNGEALAQRPLNVPHATKLAKYMLKGLIGAAKFRRSLKKMPESTALNELEALLGKQPYVSIQPIVCNLRDVDPSLSNLRGERIIAKENGETAGFKVWLSQSHLLYVVDGQHRRKAMQLLFDFLNTTITTQHLPAKGNLLSPMKGDITAERINVFQEILETASAFATVQVECHLGLDVYQERQLFHDLNNLGKKVEASLALQFDNSNPVNVYIKEVLIDDDEIFDWDIIEKDVTDWQVDTGAISRKDLVGVNARLFLNKTNISGATPSQVDPKTDKINMFWKRISEIPNIGKPGAKMKTTAAQPVVLKSLAKLAYDYGFGKNADESEWNKLLDGISTIDFSHSHPMWRYYQLSETEREEAGLAGLADYLPTDDEGFNRDIGNYDSIARTMRFGSKHNDIFPILGDMIRWRLNLPSRKK